MGSSRTEKGAALVKQGSRPEVDTRKTLINRNRTGTSANFIKYHQSQEVAAADLLAEKV